MYFQGYSVTVLPGNEDRSGYVSMKHGQKYTISLTNYTVKNCDAEVKIDGKTVGVFRVGNKNGGNGITIERPVNDSGKFTFYKAGSKEANKSGLAKVDKSNLGLI